MINFVIPSVGRKSLKNTLLSIVNQSNTNWECWVGFDGLCQNDIDENLLIQDKRIHYLFLGEKRGKFDYSSGLTRPTGNAGLVRNSIISQIDNVFEWIGFVDDDDTIRPDYIDSLIAELNIRTFDCCVFRMQHIDKINNKIIIIPPIGMTSIAQNYVGISFCVRRSFLGHSKVEFFNSSSEDFSFIKQIQDSNGVIFISENVVYDVRPGE